LKIEVILITRFRPALLERAIRSIAGALPSLGAGHELRLKLLINGADEETSRLCKGLSAEFGFLSVAEQPDAMRPGQARNQLLGHLTADWVFFLDDDAYLDPGYFATYSKLVDRYPEAVVLGGPNLTPPSSNAFQDLTGRVLASPFATYLSRSRYTAQGAVRPAGEESFILCNLWIKGSVIREMGRAPFSRILDCNEENDLLQRIASFPSVTSVTTAMIHDPELSVWHERRETWLGLLKQVMKYGRGRAQNAWLRPSSLHWAHVVPTACVLAAPFLLMAAISGCASCWIPFLIYGMALVGFSARISWKAPLLFALIHLLYGIGFLAGLVRPWRAEGE